MSISKGHALFQFVFVTLLLFLFWLLMSGIFTPKFMAIGAITSAAVAWITRPLLRLPSGYTPGKTYPAFQIPYVKFLLYLLWLLVEIVKSNIYVIKLILNPKMPIDPVIVTFKKKMDNPMAHAILGNSIALTPGTLTIEIEDDVYVIHAITKETGATLALPDGREADMVKRVGELFDKHQPGGLPL